MSLCSIERICWTSYGFLICTMNCFVVMHDSFCIQFGTLVLLSSSFRFNEIIWHNYLTNIERFFPISLVIKKNKGSKQALSNIRNSGVVISFLPVFVQFVASFECFVFMALSVRIKNLCIEKCPSSTTPKPSCTNISLCFHWYVSTY